MPPAGEKDAFGQPRLLDPCLNRASKLTIPDQRNPLPFNAEEAGRYFLKQPRSHIINILQ